MYILMILIIILLTIFLYLIFKHDPGYYWKRKGIKFEQPLFLIGNILKPLLLRQNLAVLSSELYFKYVNEPYFGIWIITAPNLVIRCPDLIKQVLIKDFDYFCDRNVACNENVDALSADMTFFMRNPKWKFIRSKSTPMFSSGKMRYIYPKIQNIASDMVSFLRSSGNDLDVRETCAKFSTEVICSTAFGIDGNSLQDEDTPFTIIGKVTFETTMRNALAAVTYFCNSPLVDILKIKFIKSSTAKFLADTFLSILEQREINKSDRRDLLNVMVDLKEHQKLSENELVAQAGQFLLGGHETMSKVICFSLYELSINKDIQDKLRNEINESIDVEGNISYISLQNMTYMDKVVSEVLRKYPPVPFLGRTCVKDYKLPHTDIVIDKGTEIMIPLMGLHYDSRYFSDPQKFDPEHFSEENVRSRHPYVYLPFGGGQRNCIGKRMALQAVKLALSHVVKNFEMEIDKRTKLPLDFSAKTFTLHTGPIYIKFKELE